MGVVYSLNHNPYTKRLITGPTPAMIALYTFYIPHI